MILSKDPNLTLELDVYKLTRDELSWIQMNCSTSIITELETIINSEHSKHILKKQKQIQFVPIKEIKAPRPKIMKKISKLKPPPIFRF